jgi:PAS domain S-box-containing protein
MKAHARSEICRRIHTNRVQIADSWYTEIAGTSQTPPFHAEKVREHLEVLVAQAAEVLVSEPLDRHAAQSIGLSLAELQFVQPATLSRTNDVLTQQFVEPLSATETVAIQPYLTILLSEMAVGFMSGAQTFLLEQQERMHRRLKDKHEQAKAALRDCTYRFRLLFEHSPDAIILLEPRHTDGAWVITDCNQGTCRMHGYTYEEIVGRPIDLLHASAAEPNAGMVAFIQLAPTGASSEETLHQRKDGMTFPVEWSSTRISTGGREQVLLIVHDITERRRAEDALHESTILRELDRLKSEFIANVSHEIRTPLHHIMGYALTLTNPLLKFEREERQEYLKIVVEEARRLERLITDLLDMSRIESGRLILRPEDVALDKIIGSVVKQWRRNETHTIEVKLPSVIPLVSADPNRIEQVLDNLLGNVIKYTPEGTRALVELQVEPEDLTISVADNGPGIESEHLPFVFDRFYQADTGTFQSRRGNGIGLYLARTIIEQHGGHIWAESIPGSGATFRFTLPREQKETL